MEIGQLIIRGRPKMLFPASLRAFYEAVRAGSIRAAGENLGIAPSSVSRQIQLLEHQMGAQLFDRSAAGVMPTFAGKMVAEYARAVLLDYDSLRADIHDLKGARRGFVRIAAVESTISERAVTAISAFRAKFDGVSFQLRMLPAPRVIEAVKLGEVDVGLTFCAPADTELRFLARFPEPIILAIAADHPMARLESVTIAELKSLPLAMPEPTFGVRQILDRASQAAGVTLTPALSTDSFDALRAFARQGAGGSLLPRLSIELDRTLGRLKSIVVDDAALTQTTADIIVLGSRRPSRLLKLFLDELQRVAQHD
jgi:DNA-binding transcriptional LysR family regulator